jgi:hypothetical protein
MTAGTIVVHIEKVPDTVQKNMTEVAHAKALLEKALNMI